MPDASPPTPGYDVALYGKDPAEGLVALHVVRDRSGREADPARMRLYWRRGFDQPDGGTVETEDVPFYPFLLIHDAELLRGFGRDRFRYQRLDESVKVEQDRGGQAYFRDLVVFTSIRDYWDAVRHVERVTETEARRPEELYFAGNPEQVYLMQSGRTLFKGMAFEHIHRLQLDIEVYAPDGFPQPERPEHAVIIVALSDNRGWSRLLHARDTSEKALLEETVRIIQERDPDVIEGHNVYGFDFDYLLKRCQLHGVPLAIGRDGSVPRQFPSSMRFAERMVDFPALDIAGRHVIDTLFQVMSFDVFKRDLPGYGLKVAAKYFGFADETRTYVEGSDIARVWDEDPARLLDYALDDVVETERLARHLSGSTFYLTQMVPMPYGQTARTGPASKIEALFVREYLRQRQALPRAAWGSQTIGGYTDVFVTGVVGPVVYADVESLYPSIMLGYDVRPKDDALGLFPDLLRKLTALRFETKAAMKATDDADDRAELDARQTAYKNIINCFSADTEIVTVDGIKPITHVEVGDLVYALNPETLEAQIKPVTAVYEQHYLGPMVSIQNRFTDFLVTPEHRFLTARFKPGGSYSSYKWETASALFDDRVPRKLPPLAPFPPASAHNLHVSVAALCGRHGIVYKRGPRGIKELRRQARWQPNDFALDDWLALLGWYVTEGSLCRSTPKVYANGNVRGESYVISLAQKQEAGCEAIEALLQRTGIAYSTSVNGFSFCSRVFYEVLDAECGSGSFEKRLPDWVFHLPPDHLQVLFDTLMAGDGNATGMRYTTSSAQLARDFVRLCLHLGRRAYISDFDGSYRIQVNNPHVSVPRGLAPVIKHEHRSQVAYDGPIHCLTVADHHTVIAGRNGLFNWTGQSFYGNLAFGMALFNDFAEADRVAATGQELLRQIIRHVRADGGTVIEVDTDGVLFVPPDGIRGDAEERAYVRTLSERMPEGIRIGFDGRFQKMLSYKKKNYALLGYDGRIKFKGSSLVSRSTERFGRRFVREAVRLLLEENIQGLHDLYLAQRDRILAHDWTDGVADFQRTETLKNTVAAYEADVEAGRRTRTASYELAKQRAAQTGQPPRKGDRISYYIAGPGPAFEAARLADTWDPAAPDEHTPYYLDRLDQVATKFASFFETEHQFRLVFSPEDLFGFDASGIRLARAERAVEDVSDDVPF